MISKSHRFVVDSWAWIEYLDGSEIGSQIKNYIEDEKNIILTSSLTIAEVVSRFLRKRTNPHEAVAAISSLSRVLPADLKIAAFAGELHAEIRASIKDFGLADSFILAAAKVEKAIILTGDPHFKGFPEALVFRK